MADTMKIKSEEVNQQSSDFLSLENLVKSYAVKIEGLEKELKEKNQTLKDAFESDAVYHEQAEKAKEANKIKNATKKEILKQPALAELAERVKEIKFDIAEQEAMLADYLRQYKEQSGATEIELGNGEVMEIVTVTKLVKQSSRSKE